MPERTAKLPRNRIRRTVSDTLRERTERPAGPSREPAAGSTDPRRPYAVGTLRYSLGGIILVSVWIILGGKIYSLLNLVIPTLLPLTMKQYGASAALTGLVIGSLPAVMNFVMNPILSTASDRTRTRWGRRIPYLAAATPFVALFMILIGWVPPITAFLHREIFPAFSLNSLGIVLICLFSVLFQFFNLVVGSIYYYVFADVIPHQFISRFMTAMNLGGALLGVLFNLYVMPHAMEYSLMVYTGIGVVYLIVFMLMCVFVREGAYPPPPPVRKREFNWCENAVNWVRVYCRQCYRHWFFLFLFLGAALNDASIVCRSTFNLVFAVDELHLDTGQYGQVMAAGQIAALIAVAGVGLIMDKIHPLRVYIGSGIIIILVNLWGYFFVHSFQTFFVVGVAFSVVYGIQVLSTLPVFIALFPSDKYGQFSSAFAMMKSLMLILANYCGGLAIDCFGYRFIFVWDFAFTIMATLALLYVYVRWRQLGGAEGYVPPPTD